MSDPSTYEPVDVSGVTDPEIIALARLDAELEAQHNAVMAALDDLPLNPHRECTACGRRTGTLNHTCPFCGAVLVQIGPDGTRTPVTSTTPSTVRVCGPVTD
ncbi:hypothetical protein [Acidipropionibacterium jensenii]|uniref:hypothetical protein n=1 Tax=Acidipropionibacterium jensenii TaxID=1749 RepID=UPI002648F2EB|nr:hypothetical protein [Acidipropionibacterium jensenii]MDN6556520.1 hypothetical protein [Acidipropionibacterium acidipropionici]MDN5978106.1 hypothetical protein [Acidipropionibacterium jensenii]MDN5997092.1 hypothetical protein [Acidipropionibacterium jensenii]MDN6427467.1 hypothetical protein [Acidipropionibacterium jensenii]MDN6481077.1 hypothetical protein [Acidipropionibacterium jensenii]